MALMEWIEASAPDWIAWTQGFLEKTWSLVKNGRFDRLMHNWWMIALLLAVGGFLIDQTLYFAAYGEETLPVRLWRGASALIRRLRGQKTAAEPAGDPDQTTWMEPVRWTSEDEDLRREAEYAPAQEDDPAEEPEIASWLTDSEEPENARWTTNAADVQWLDEAPESAPTAEEPEAMAMAAEPIVAPMPVYAESAPTAEEPEAMAEESEAIPLAEAPSVMPMAETPEVPDAVPTVWASEAAWQAEEPEPEREPEETDFPEQIFDEPDENEIPILFNEQVTDEPLPAEADEEIFAADDGAWDEPDRSTAEVPVWMRESEAADEPFQWAAPETAQEALADRAVPRAYSEEEPHTMRLTREEAQRRLEAALARPRMRETAPEPNTKKTRQVPKAP